MQQLRLPQRLATAGTGAARARGVRGAARSTSRCRSARCSATRVLPGAARPQVVPVLKTYPSIKIWVAGCSTGEEVWSLAILLAEEGLLERTLIYATRHQSGSAEDGARRASTRSTGVARFSENYLRGRRHRFALRLLPRGLRRRRVRPRLCGAARVFSDHSLATDSVFSEVHLVSCRNVLIYFDGPCRTARSACSTRRWCAAASSGSAPRRACGSPRTPPRSRNCTARSGSTANAEREESRCGRHRRLGRRRRGDQHAARRAAGAVRARRR